MVMFLPFMGVFSPGSNLTPAVCRVSSLEVWVPVLRPAFPYVCFSGAVKGPFLPELYYSCSDSLKKVIISLYLHLMGKK